LYRLFISSAEYPKERSFPPTYNTIIAGLISENRV